MVGTIVWVRNPQKSGYITGKFPLINLRLRCKYPTVFFAKVRSTLA